MEYLIIFLLKNKIKQLIFNYLSYFFLDLILGVLSSRACPLVLAMVLSTLAVSWYPHPGSVHSTIVPYPEVSKVWVRVTAPWRRAGQTMCHEQLIYFHKSILSVPHFNPFNHLSLTPVPPGPPWSPLTRRPCKPQDSLGPGRGEGRGVGGGGQRVRVKWG